MNARRFAAQLLYAAIAAFVLGIALDSYVLYRDGASFIGALCGVLALNDYIPLWSALRDGVFANVLFFLTAGLISSVASWRNPKDYQLVQRVIALYPKLEHHLELITPVVRHLKRFAGVSVRSEMTVRFMDWNQAAVAYRLDVVRSETIQNLLPSEPYEHKDFKSEVYADIGQDPSILEVGLVHDVFMTVVKPRQEPPVSILGRQSMPLTRGVPCWRSVGRLLTIPPDGEAIYKMDYWILAEPGIRWLSHNNRPTTIVELTVVNCLSSGESIEIRCGLLNEPMTPHVFVLGRNDRKVLRLDPSQALPVVYLDFARPGATLSE